QSYNFMINPGSGGTVCGCSGQVLEIFLLNSGSSTTTISAVYYDGALETLAVAPQAQMALAAATAYHTQLSHSQGRERDRRYVRVLGDGRKNGLKIDPYPKLDFERASRI